MVKSRKATIRAKPLPNLYNVQKVVAPSSWSSGGSGNVTMTTKLVPATSNGGNRSSSTRSLTSAATSKRAIFSHLSRLQHGILRYRNIASSPTSVTQNTSVTTTDKDRKFVYVPAHYYEHVRNETHGLKEILQALQLPPTLPPLLVVTAATNGAVEEILEHDDDYNMNSVRDFNTTIVVPDDDNDNDDDPLTPDEERELLREKTHEILTSTVELCGQLGAWLIPHRPRRANGAAEILCNDIASTPVTTSSTSSTIAKSGDSPNNNNNNNNKAVILGMIGLDHQDQKEGFTQLIVEHMVPVGTDITNVAIVHYDPNKRDHLPCPELTHLLLFERRDEMRAFRDGILSQIPDILLAFGKTTPYAKKSLCSSLIRQSPVALITHTSPEIDHMAWMLKHADREMRKINVGAVVTTVASSSIDANNATDSTVINNGTLTTTTTTASYPTLPLPPLRDLEGVDPELYDFVANQWPACHNDERIVLADPRRVGGMQFQQEFLRAVNAAYYIEQARTVALQHATTLLGDLIQPCANSYRKITEQWHLCMVGASFAAVAMAVLYAKIYANDPPPSIDNRNPFQIAMFVVTLVLPLLIVWFKRRYDASSQVWSQVQKEAALLESAISAFRTRPRSYVVNNSATTSNRSNSSGNNSQSHQKDDPLESFVHFICEVQQRVAPMLLTKKASPGGDYATLNSLTTTTAVSTSLPAIKKDTETSPNSDPNGHYDIEAPPPPPTRNESTPLLPRAATTSPPCEIRDFLVNGVSTKWKKPSLQNATDYSNNCSDENCVQDAYKGCESIGNTYDSTMLLVATENETTPTEKGTASSSEESLLWTTKTYIDCRIHAACERKRAEVQVLERRHRIMETIIKVVVGSTSLLALLSKQWIIPIVLGISAAFVTSQDFRKYQSRLQQGQEMIASLDELMEWFTSLPVEEKILNVNQDRLVQSAERIIVADVSFTY